MPLLQLAADDAKEGDNFGDSVLVFSGDQSGTMGHGGERRFLLEKVLCQTQPRHHCHQGYNSDQEKTL